MPGRSVHQKLHTTYLAGTHVAFVAFVLVVACAPAPQRTPSNQPRVAPQPARVAPQLRAEAVDRSFRFSSHPDQGVVLGQYGLDTRGFVITQSVAPGVLSQLSLRKAESRQAYIVTYGEWEGNEYPFAIALPAGRYYFAHSGRSLTVPMRVFRVSTSPVPGALTARAWFDVVPGVVTCIGRVALELELMMTSRNVASVVPRDIGVTDTCEKLAATYRSRLSPVSDSMHTRLAVVAR